MKLDLGRTPFGQSSLAMAGEFELAFGPDGPARVVVEGDVRVDNLEGRCLVRGELAAAGPASCGRCLEEFDLRFVVPLELMILRDAGQEVGDPDSPVMHQREGIVDLRECVREAVVLAVPLVRICRDDCQGICAGCGADLNAGPCGCAETETDPRWDGLPG